jgi:hypothetical protein
MLTQDKERQIIDEIKHRMVQDGMLVIPAWCELLGVVQDDGTFMPYAPNGTYVRPESKAAQMHA